MADDGSTIATIKQRFSSPDGSLYRTVGISLEELEHVIAEAAQERAGGTVSQLDDAARQALDRLVTVAQGDSGQSRRCADFLLAWHNAGENGGFDLTTPWGLDDELVEACCIAFRFISTHRVYPDELGYRREIENIWKLWSQGE